METPENAEVVASHDLLAALVAIMDEIEPLDEQNAQNFDRDLAMRHDEALVNIWKLLQPHDEAIRDFMANAESCDPTKEGS